jgi:glycosyltransferase involved in cell wall biosynthesis
MEKISIAIPTYNRYEMTLESFSDVIDDERIAEVVISDDASDWSLFNTLKTAVSSMPKVRISRNLSNQDCYFNKRTSISLCLTDYVIILDSDNKIDKSYLDAIYSKKWNPETIFAPEYAKPQFDYRDYSGLTLTKENISEYIDLPMLSTALNTMNYFVHRYNYIKVFDMDTDPVTSDSLYQNYNWLKEGYNIHILKGLQYNHLVHSGSHYINNVARTPSNFNEILMNKLRNLK